MTFPNARIKSIYPLVVYGVYRFVAVDVAYGLILCFWDILENLYSDASKLSLFILVPRDRDSFGQHQE